MGLIPSLGLHHASRMNAFNLADDLIEPFRPYVDQMVARHQLEPDEGDITLEDRHFMTGVLSQSALIGQETVSILTATEKIATSLVQALEHSSAALLQLPVLPTGGTPP